MKWLMHEDNNTKCFHQTTLARRRRNKILCIKNSEGEWIEGEREIMHELHSLYSNLFPSDRLTTENEGDLEETLSSLPN